MTFPVIKNIADVLPFLDDNFRIIAKDDGLTYINYNNAGPDTFPLGDGHAAKIRRECRGIAFNTETGELKSRPFHKFFNIGERPDTTLEIGSDWVALEKLDGSMIRPVPVGDSFRLATKAGVTDVAMQAETWLAKQTNFNQWADQIMQYLGAGMTLLFEFTSPDNKIVLDYETETLTLLAVRDNITGKYIKREALESYHKLFPELCPWPLVQQEDLSKASYIISAQDVEGIVYQSYEGQFLKLKSEWYVKAHRAKEILSTEKGIVTMILEGYDDILPTLLEGDRRRLETANYRFWSYIDNISSLLNDAYFLIRREYPTKKDYAISSQDKQGSSEFRAIMFKLWDGNVSSTKEAVLDLVKTSLTRREKFDRMKKVLSMGDLV